MADLQTLLLHITILSLLSFVELNAYELCNRQWPPNCDPITLGRFCQYYHQKNKGKCTQVVFDSQQNTKVEQCFMHLLVEAHSTVLVRSFDKILDQNIYDFDKNIRTNRSVVNKYCKTVFVLGDDSTEWIDWLDNSIRPVTITQKRFYPFNQIFVVSHTRPTLQRQHSDYMFHNNLQLFWIRVNSESNETNVLQAMHIEHLPTNKSLQFDLESSSSYEIASTDFMRFGDSHRWQSFYATRAFRSSQTNCVPYVIPIYNSKGSIIRFGF